MKFLPLILRNLLRRKVRTTFTILSIVVAFVLFGLLMAIRAAFSHGRRPRRRRPADGDPPRVDHPAAAPELRAEDPRHARRDRPDPRQLVRGLLPGPEQLHGEHGGRSRELAAHVSGVRDARGAEEGLARRPGRRHRRHRHREEVRVEGRRSRAADLADLPQAGRTRRGTSRSTASTIRRRRAWTRPSSSSTTTT